MPKVKKENQNKSGLLWRLIKGLFLLTFFLLIAGIGAAYIAYYQVSKDLPNVGRLKNYPFPAMSTVYAEDGTKIGEFWKEKRIVVKYEEMPKHLINGFVASEDQRFFDHGGIDFYGIVRAMLSNFQAGKIVEGASTITQQVIKNMLLTSEKSYSRKFKEAILAYRIEGNLSKEQILYLYLNQIYFGNRAYGVGAAAQNYFKKDLKDLKLAELAMIVGLSKGPSRYNPVVNPKRARARQRYVINRMREMEFISQAEADAAIKYKFKVYQASVDKIENLKTAPYFIEEVRRYLIGKYGYDRVYKGGLKIHTTLNLEIYNNAQKILRNYIDKYDKNYGYIGPESHIQGDPEIKNYLKQQHIDLINEDSSIDYSPYSGKKDAYAKLPTPIKEDRDYLAIVLGRESNIYLAQIGRQKLKLGPKEYKLMGRSRSKFLNRGDVIRVRRVKQVKKVGQNQKKDSSKKFKLVQKPQIQSALYSYEPFTGKIRAAIGGYSFRHSEFNRATQAKLQPGSTIKPLIYAAAMDKGYTASTIIMDSPIRYHEGGGKYWTPKNAGNKYRGPIPMRTGLTYSINVIAVRILMDIGTHYMTAFLRKLGLSTPINKFYSMALGANEVQLAEITRAYGIFPTGGVLPKTHSVTKVIDREGQVVEELKVNPDTFVVQWTNKIKDRNAENVKALQAVTIKHQSSYENMNYRDDLKNLGEAQTKEDKIYLTQYEKKILWGNYIPRDHVISPRTAVRMTRILQNVVRSGTGTRALALKRQAAGKTGTTNKSTDAWFIGFTPNLVTGVWVGFDKERRSIGRGASGGRIAAPIWLAFMKMAEQHYPEQKFKLAKGVNVNVFKSPVQVVGLGDDELLGIGGVDIDFEDNSNSPGGGSSGGFFLNDFE